MEGKIWIVLMVAGLIGLSEANREKKMSLSELKGILNDENRDSSPKEVAKLLEQFEDKELTIHGDVKIKSLLQLSDPSYYSIQYCTGEHLLTMEELRKKVSENRYLFEFCTDALRKMYAFCKTRVGELYDFKVRYAPGRGKVLDYSGRIMSYLQVGRLSETEANIKHIIQDRFSDSERKSIRESCRHFVTELIQNGFNFDTEDKLTYKHVHYSGFELEARLRKHCALVVEVDNYLVSYKPTRRA